MKKKFIALIEVDDSEINADNATEVATWLAMAGAGDVTVWAVDDQTLEFSTYERLMARDIWYLIRPLRAKG